MWVNTCLWRILKRHNFRVHASLGSAETLVRRGGIINHHSIAYSLSNISAKNYRNRLMWVESIVCNISVVFLVSCFWDTCSVVVYNASSCTNLCCALQLQLKNGQLFKRLIKHKWVVWYKLFFVKFSFAFGVKHDERVTKRWLRICTCCTPASASLSQQTLLL